MKRSIFNVFNIILVTTFTFSCSEDDKKATKPEPVFKLKDNTISYSLEQGNLLLLEEDVYEDFGYRNYVITDGEYIEGEDGDELNDYTGATYLVFIQLAVRDSFTPTDYIQSTSWSSEPGDFYSYLYMGSTEELSLFTDVDDSPIKISGGFNDGETMRLEFAGELNYSRLDQSSGNIINTDEEVIFFFEGTIDDRRQWD